MIIITAYWIAGIIGLIYSVILLVAVVKIWRLLNEIITSGAVPSVLNARAKRDAKKILAMEYAHNLKRVDWLCEILSEMRNDREAIQLSQQLKDLKKQQTA
ncbi:MAG: hypothetical protein OEZ00_09685 [Dehalococcoidia bacterium]|nr:hypothetical protein [Dehalococcoidia bacterium]